MRCARAFLLALAAFLFALPVLAGPSDGLPKPSVVLDRATPRQAYDGFHQATHAGDFVRAAHFLDLRAIPRSRQPVEGPELARQLAYVLERKLPIDLATLSDAPDGAAGPSNMVVLGSIFVDDEPIPIAMSRVRFDDGTFRWIFARTTISVLPELYGEHGARGWETRLPKILVATRVFGIEAWQWLALLAALLIAWITGWAVGAFVVSIGRRLAARTQTEWDDELVVAAKNPVRLVLAVVTLSIVDDPLHFSPAVARVARLIAFPVLVVGVAWMLVGALGVLTAWILSRLPSDPEAELRSRGLKTQLAVMRRVTTVLVVICACAVILMQFELVRSVGLSLLASAGLVGVVLGFAAQKSLGGVIAGIQLSITQPIRIGDTVAIEGEFGIIEEINLTYVIVKVWDERRLVVPIVKFLETTFQNWTRITHDLQGVVHLSVDYTAPVDRFREELERVAKGDARWDGRTCKLHVTDVTDKVMVLRALVSARNSDELWELRCAVREKMMRFAVEHEGGKFLPQLRSKPNDPPALAPGAAPGTAPGTAPTASPAR